MLPESLAWLAPVLLVLQALKTQEVLSAWAARPAAIDGMSRSWTKPWACVATFSWIFRGHRAVQSCTAWPGRGEVLLRGVTGLRRLSGIY